MYAAVSRDAASTLRSLEETRKSCEETLARSKSLTSASDELDAKWKHFQGLMDHINNAMVENMKGMMGVRREDERPGVVVPVETMAQVLHRSKKVVLLTGAGVSAESGIPTFRGADGFWTIGSQNYRPQEMATFKMFNDHPEELWRWYHQRWSICRNAAPNPGHAAAAELERLCKASGSFALITQNIDGLHLAAGSSPETTFQVHGSMKRMRCDESQPGSCASQPGADLPTAARENLVHEYGSLDAAFAALSGGASSLSAAQLARGLHAHIFPTKGSVDAAAAAAGLQAVFEAVRAPGEAHATRESFRAGLAADAHLRAAIFPWGDEWSEERVAQDPVPRCPKCSGRCRPEVLWFDESYDELHYRAESATAAAADADCLVVVGTTLTTGLPQRIVRGAKERGVPVLNIDPDCLADPRPGMLNLPARSGAALPALVAALKALRAEPAPPPLRPAEKVEGRRAAPVAKAKEVSRSRRPNPVALPGALKKEVASGASTRASTPEERVFLCGPGAPQDGAPALLRGASLYCAQDAPALVLEQTAMAVRGVLSSDCVVPKGHVQSSLLVDRLDPADPSKVLGQERATVYHCTQVDRMTALVLPDGDWRSRRA